MTVRRDELEAAGRMDGAGNRVVRTGDALALTSTASDPALRLDAADLVHVGHQGVRLVIDRSARSAGLGPGVVASLGFESLFQPGVHVEMQLLDRPPAELLGALREAEGGGEVMLDAGFDLITPLHYPFVAAIEASDLPRTIA